MKRRMVVLLVDALGWELASRTPGFAAALEHRRRLDTVLGFSTGALPTLFTGRMPCEHGRFLMYRRARSGTPFRGFEGLRWLPARVQRSGRLTRLLTRVVEGRGVRGYFHLYEVPRWLLPEFDLAERDDVFVPGGLPVRSLWDALAARGIPWAGRNWRTREADNFDWLERAVATGDDAFLFCYTADLDATLHREGAAGDGVRERIHRYGERLARLLATAERRHEELWIYLLSDHGMVDVRETVDVMSLLGRLGISWPRDYLAFFDSTMARFWWRSGGARERVRAALAESGGGRWLDDAELELAGALFPGREYGEDIFLLHPGTLMVPSFMGHAPLRAMHGYEASHPGMAALLWSNRPVPERVRHLRDVRAFLESELGALEQGAA